MVLFKQSLNADIQLKDTKQAVIAKNDAIWAM